MHPLAISKRSDAYWRVAFDDLPLNLMDRRRASRRALLRDADDVQTVVIPGAGHWVAEHAPEELLAALTVFLARTATEGESPERRPP